MTMKRAKRNCGETFNKEPNNMDEDRISQLPDSLIHHIFSLLPTIYIVRMSCLSKRWRRVWVSTPFLHFEGFKNVDSDCITDKKGMFLRFVDNFMEGRRLFLEIPDRFITTFKIDAPCDFGRCSTKKIDGWLRFAFQGQVKELDLNLREYCLPQFVLNASSLTKLKLTDMQLEAPSVSKFPNLKVLSLVSVKFDLEAFQNLICGCPVIEDLHLNENAVFFKDFAATVGGTLRSLSLSHLKLTGRWLEGLISQLPILERFTLFKCYELKDISICSHSLTSISITNRLSRFGNPYELKNVNINSHSLKSLSMVSLSEFEAAFRTPNLDCLELTCYPTSIISIEAPNLLETNLVIWDSSTDDALYLERARFLSNLNYLKKMMLSVCLETVLIISFRLSVFIVASPTAQLLIVVV